MGWPQFVFAGLLVLGCGVAIGTHGTPKEGHNNAWATIIATIIEVTILYYGGFWG